MLRRKRFVASGLLMAITALVMATPAIATDWDTCSYESGDIAIAACTREIESGKHKGTNLGQLYIKRGVEFYNKSDYDHALADSNQAIRLAPNSGLPFLNRGKVFRAKGELSRAIAEFDHAIQLDPKYAYSYQDRGVAYYKMKDYDRAIRDYDQAIRLNSKLTMALYGRGVAKLKKGDNTGGNIDIAAAIAKEANIATEFSRYELK
jgi:tetratricopeptide (TPR) repeat protein